MRRQPPGELLIQLEADVARTVKRFMLGRGWRPLRMQAARAQNRLGGWVSFGEDGMADFLFLRYFGGARPGASLSVWVETKRTKGKLLAHQAAWRAEEIRRGAVVLKADSPAQFMLDYYRLFGWLHSAVGVGQIELFA